ncbi:unnamed protein product [Lathyrus sativus]|nr:unnamed protein product [Lathyrus sativus]
MKYLHRKMQGLSGIPSFNYHGKCEKLNIVDISFPDDLLLFTRGDVMYVQLVMDRLNAFSRSTGLCVNPSKCKMYRGDVDADSER